MIQRFDKLHWECVLKTTCYPFKASLGCDILPQKFSIASPHSFSFVSLPIFSKDASKRNKLTNLFSFTCILPSMQFFCCFPESSIWFWPLSFYWLTGNHKHPRHDVMISWSNPRHRHDQLMIQVECSEIKQNFMKSLKLWQPS